MPDITLTGGTAVGEEVSTNHFGVNATFNYQPYSAFVNSSQPMNLTTARYPGGTETELYFDFTQPNRDFVVHANGNQTNDAGEVGFNLIPMDRFLAHCVAAGIQPTIVVPMTQLIATDRGFDEAQTQALRDFITSVLTQMGSIGVASFELGNEYQAQFSGAEHFNSSAEYGDVSSAAALIIQGAIDDYNAANGYDDAFVEPRIEVQIWGYATNPNIDLFARNEAVFDEFDADELAAVDGVVSHYYYNSDLYGIDGIATAIADITAMMEHWQANTNQDLAFAITEWSVSFLTTEYTGMRQVAPVLEMFSEFVGSGIDTMDFWSVQYHNTSLASPGNNLTLIGDFMELLEETIEGMVVLEIGAAPADFAVHAFSNGDQAVVFISALTYEGGQNLNLDFSAIFPQIDGVSATVLGYGGTSIDGHFRDNAPDNIGRVWHDYDEPDAELTQTSYAISNFMDGDVTFSLGGYEVMMLEFDLSTLAAISGSNTINGTHYSETINGQGLADSLFGGGGNDYLYGNDGNDTLHGDSGSDVLYGENGSDQIYGGTGSDWMIGGAGNDWLYGGTGADNLRGDDGNDVLFGDNGDDDLRGASGEDILYGGIGNDTLYGGTESDHLHGDDGNDALDGGGGSDVLYGENGNDQISGGTGNDWLFGGNGGDRIFGDAGADNLRGDAGNDALFGGAGADNLRGGLGNDLLYGEDGNDTIYGDAGDDALRGRNDNDVLYGGAGADDLQGDDGDDWLFGGTENDTLYGNAGNDSLRGDDGNDTLYGGVGNDNLRGGLGNDLLYGEDGSDIIHGDAGDDALRGRNDNDVLYGGAGADDLQGDDGNDLLYGQDGSDTIYGGAGVDALRGGDGNDILYGGMGTDNLQGGDGNDTMSGGIGADIFIFDTGFGSDIIADFSVSEGDTLDFSSMSSISSMADLTIAYGTSNTVIANGGDSITLEGTTAALQADDFIF